MTTFLLMQIGFSLQRRPFRHLGTSAQSSCTWGGGPRLTHRPTPLFVSFLFFSFCFVFIPGQHSFHLRTILIAYTDSIPPLVPLSPYALRLSLPPLAYSSNTQILLGTVS